jgi:hypothetical protein
MAQRTAQARDVEEFLGRYAGQDSLPRPDAATSLTQPHPGASRIANP